MAPVTPHTPPSLRDTTGEYVWEKDSRNLRTWFRIFWISFVAGIASMAPLGDPLSPLLSAGIWISFVTGIGCVVYAYRVQSKLRSLGLARTDPAFIIIAAVLISPWLTAFIASLGVRSNVNKATRRGEQGE